MMWKRKTAHAVLLAAGLAVAGCGSSDADGSRSGSSATGRTETGPDPAPVAAASMVPMPAPAEPRLARASVAVKKGEPLDLALRRLELEPQERFVVAHAFAEKVDLRRILPGEEVEVARDADGNVREMILRRDLLRSVVAKFPEEGEPSVESHERVPDVSVTAVSGALNGSLYESILSSGGDANLTMRYADLLAWQVDFLTEPRGGDRFRILVEEESLDGESLGFGKILAAEYHGDRTSARAIRYEDSEGHLDWYDDDGHSVRRAFLKSPLNYRRISSRFTAKRRHPVLKRVMPHWGVDYAAAQGTPVSALGDGVVQFAGRNGGFGNYIEIRHNSTYTTCYGHLWKFAKGIKKGARVEQGELVGYVGSTGLSTGPHLDFRVKKRGEFVDPLRLESPAGRTISDSERPRFDAELDRLWRLADRYAPVPEQPGPTVAGAGRSGTSRGG